MRKEISLVTAIILSGFLGLALPGCSEDKNKSTGDGGKTSGPAKDSKTSPGTGTGGSTTGSGTSGSGGSGSGGSGS
jgi:hypothetical protein